MLIAVALATVVIAGLIAGILWISVGPRSAAIQRVDGYELWTNERSAGGNAALVESAVVWHPEGGCFVESGGNSRRPVLFPHGTRLLGGDMGGAQIALPGVGDPVTIGVVAPTVLYGGGGDGRLPEGFTAADTCWSGIYRSPNVAAIDNIIEVTGA